MLNPPSPDFGARNLPAVRLNAGNLYRIGHAGRVEPHFGRSPANRFDDRSCPPTEPFRTCYAALSLRTSFAETVLHDEHPVGGAFVLTYEQLRRRTVVRFDAVAIRIADLTGSSLKVLGGNGALSTIIPYDLPQQWSRAVYDHPDRVDGFQYMSRHINTDRAVVVFDRAKAQLRVSRCTPLLSHPDLLHTLGELHVTFVG